MKQPQYIHDVWLDDSELEQASTSEYWNAREIERNKASDISGGEFDRMEAHLEKKGKLRHLEDLIADLEQARLTLHGQGISLGSGTCWLEARLLKAHRGIELLRCMDFSKHRIFELAPLLLDHYGIEQDRAVLCLGSFDDIRIEDGSLDFVILGQAFHHTDKPAELLGEVARILKTNGIVLIYGEHYFSPVDVTARVFKHFAKWLLNHRGYRSIAGIMPKWRVLFPGDPDGKGDHHYQETDHQNFFKSAGLRYRRTISPAPKLQGFILQKDSDALNARQAAA